MNDQDSATIIVTVLLLLPWFGRVATSAISAWREHAETPRDKGKQKFRIRLSA